MIRRSAPKRVRAAAAVAAYPRWRPERDAVRAAHRVWIAATALGKPLAIEAYQSALDREERAVDAHTRLMRCVRHPAKTGPAHQMALKQGVPAAWEGR